jgi:DNA-binding response OmpR family regulator
MHEDRRKRVLIIEDEASIGLMVAEILADEGFGVIGPVGNRREALSALEDRQPHAAVLDLGLEDGFCVGLTGALGEGHSVPCFLGSRARQHHGARA